VFCLSFNYNAKVLIFSQKRKPPNFSKNSKNYFSKNFQDNPAAPSDSEVISISYYGKIIDSVSPRCHAVEPLVHHLVPGGQQK
jgi:hypothetical protein